MSEQKPLELESSFFSLDAETVIACVEQAMQRENPGIQCSGHVLALNSLENRVYQVGLDDRSFVVAKFYRPHRWTEDQILDEHEFIDKLDEIEVPVIPAFSLAEGSLIRLCESDSLAQTKDGIFMTVFPKVGGRLRDELDDSSLRTLGRYLGRIHQLTQQWRVEHRLSMNSDFYTKEPLGILENCPFLKDATKARYLSVAGDFLLKAREKMDRAKKILVHGDCHLGNVLWQDESAFLLDFDDCMVGPAVQDIWMVVRERGAEGDRKKSELLSGYEQMCEFDPAEFQLIEWLRGLRIIYYSSWIAKRWKDPSFPRAFPSFTEPGYWNSEIEALYECLENA